MKLTPRFTVAFILYAAVLLIGVGLFAYNSGTKALREATASELSSTALEKEAALTKWVQEKETDIGTLAGNPDLLSESAVLLRVKPGMPDYAESRSVFLASVQPYLSSGEFLEVSLLHPQTGQVVVSTDPNEEGKFREDRLYFLEGKTHPYVQNPYYSVALQSITMSASAPLVGANGELLGVLAARLDMQDMNDIIRRRTELHETDDIYLANTSNLFVTQPRFISDPAVLLRGVHTEDVRRCLQQESGVMNTVDYRDVPAIVVYRWLPARDLCLVVKLDETEAYSPARAFGGTIVMISVVALLVAAAIANALARGLTRPIHALQVGASRFARGELGSKLDEDSNDELGQLAAEFNRMAEALTEQRTHIQRRAEQFFNLTPDLLCTVDASGHLLDFNPAWENTLGYARDDLVGKQFDSLIHPEDVLQSKAALQLLWNESGTVHFESRFCHKNANYRWLAWSAVISPQDNLLYIAARDITEHHLSETRLREQAEELERSNRELQQFAYVATHDLQEPLRLVTNYVQLLARRYEDRLDEEADEYIAFALEGASRMQSLMNDLLAYARLGTQTGNYASVEMENVLELTMEKLMPDIQKTAAVVTHDPLPSTLGNGEQMELLLENLIQNAIKFGGTEPPRIHIGVKPFNERWLFFLRDNGIGIDPLHTEQIFGIFQRLHSPEEFPGNGIGLAICRKIVEQHGGRIWVDSELGKGSTFYFTLSPAVSVSTQPVPLDVKKSSRRDAIVDRATDLI